MKKKQLLILSILLLSILIIYSCRKSVQNLVNGESVSSDVIESAQIWHDSHVTATGVSLKAIWSQSWSLNTTKNGKLLVVPARERSLDNPDRTIRRFLVFSMSGSKVINGKIIEFLGRKYNISDNIDKLITEYYNNSAPADFNGSIFEYDINYAYLTGARFENGKKLNVRATLYHETQLQMRLQFYRAKIKRQVFSASKFAANGTSKQQVNDDVPVSYTGGWPPPETVGADCTLYYEEDDGMSNDRVTDVTYVYEGMSCPIPTGGESGASAAASSSSASDDGNNNGNPQYGQIVYGGNTEFLSYDIAPNVQKCITDMLNSLKAAKTIQDLMQYAFGVPSSPSSNDVADILVDVANGPNHRLSFTQVDIPNDDNGNRVDADSQTPSIRLDNTYLHEATDLGIARSVIHEVVHKYFLWNIQSTDFPTTTTAEFENENQLLYEQGTIQPGTQDAQHQAMAVKYVQGIGKMVYAYATMKGITVPSWYTGSMQDYCNDLAWGGLQGTRAYGWIPTQDSDRIDKVIAAEAADPTTSHQTGTTTKSCN